MHRMLHEVLAGLLPVVEQRSHSPLSEGPRHVLGARRRSFTPTQSSPKLLEPLADDRALVVLDRFRSDRAYVLDRRVLHVEYQVADQLFPDIGMQRLCDMQAQFLWRSKQQPHEPFALELAQ